jgi:hypothetical protein
LANGLCATAFGPSSTNGTVTAKTISVRPAGPDGCETGFGAGAGAGAAGAAS